MSAQVTAPAIYTTAEHMEVMKRFDSGDITAAELQAACRRAIESKQFLKAEFNKRTTQQLKRYTWGRIEKKADMVSAAYNSLLSCFCIESMQWSPTQETKEEAQIRTVDAITDEQIQAYAAKRKAKADAVIKALETPETLAEYEQFIHLRGINALTYDQRVTFDRLQAEKTFKMKESSGPAQTVQKLGESESYTLSLKEGFHTKKQVPLWIVQVDQRVERETYNELNTKAKMLGGYYSSFVKADAGFIFQTKEAAEKFMALQNEAQDRTEILEERAERKQAATAERLGELAERITERAEDKLNQERKANTHRRAAMAASAEAQAQHEIFIAKTILAVSEAVTAGQAPFLAGVKHKTQIEQLERLLRDSKRNAEIAQGMDWHQGEKRALAIEDIAHVVFPYPSIYHEWIRETVEAIQNKKGGKLLAGRIKKWKTPEGSQFFEIKNKHCIEELEQAIRVMEHTNGDRWLRERLTRSLEAYKRVNAMSLTNEATLKTALREYFPLRGDKPKACPIKEAKRRLIGQQIPGYFPTPDHVIDRMINLANIGTGHSVLEPSAGSGHIAAKIDHHYPDNDLTVIEYNFTLREILTLQGFEPQGQDFLEHHGEYDRILMNPPFENMQDVDHVMHAYECLKPGGRIVAITSESPFFRQDKKAEAFREFVDAHGYSDKLEPETFMTSDRPTGVNTRLVVIEKPHQ